MTQDSLVDAYGRCHNYLRISVTDRCNLRCLYCMGPEGIQSIEHEKILKYEEILQVITAGAALGINRIRITGGEPLVRRGLASLIQAIKKLPEIQDLSMTTNGALLKDQAFELRQAGLDRVNISLDSLRPATYQKITGHGELLKVLQGINEAKTIGFKPLKINVVLLKGVNDREIIDFINFARELELHLRFIEYMPIGDQNLVQTKLHLPVDYVIKVAAAAGIELKPTEIAIENGTAENYQIAGSQATVGLIHPVSHSFCATCNRLRLTADGYLKPCLYWQDEIPVKPALGDPAKLINLIKQAILLKKGRHQMGFRGAVKFPNFETMRGMSRIGG
jgi:cyclic pyranopterin phosphate synthase